MLDKVKNSKPVFGKEKSSKDTPDTER